MKYYVYLVECSDGSFYCGYTNDLKDRIKKHNTSNLGAKYTRSRRPVRLVYSEVFDSKSAAMKREYEIKGMSRVEKSSLFSP